ncbi:MAG TPA: hypothetical protein VF351_01390 [Actinomycetota bacterium]
MADGRHAATPSRKALLAIAGALVVAALVGVIVVALSGGDGPLDVFDGDTPETPAFAFEVTKPKPVETATDPNHQQAVTAAEAPADAVAERIDDLYTAAFLDPSNWMEGSYDEILDLFDRGARDAAERQLDVLTAGPGAAGAFDTITPMPSTLKLHVLFDPAGLPQSVEGSARFVAKGTGADGLVIFISKGQFIFEKSDGTWLVVSFSVRRSDEAREPKPASSSPGASPQPSGAEAS